MYIVRHIFKKKHIHIKTFIQRYLSNENICNFNYIIHITIDILYGLYLSFVTFSPLLNSYVLLQIMVYYNTFTIQRSCRYNL